MQILQVFLIKNAISEYFFFKVYKMKAPIAY